MSHVKYMIVEIPAKKELPKPVNILITEEIVSYFIKWHVGPSKQSYVILGRFGVNSAILEKKLDFHIAKAIKKASKESTAK